MLTQQKDSTPTGKLSPVLVVSILELVFGILEIMSGSPGALSVLLVLATAYVCWAVYVERVDVALLVAFAVCGVGGFFASVLGSVESISSGLSMGLPWTSFLGLFGIIACQAAAYIILALLVWGRLKQRFDDAKMRRLAIAATAFSIAYGLLRVVLGGSPDFLSFVWTVVNAVMFAAYVYLLSAWVIETEGAA